MISDASLEKMRQKEWLVFVKINVLFPFACIFILRAFDTFEMLRIIVLSVQTLVFLANFYRITKGNPRFKWLYIGISILNFISLPLHNDMSFATSVPDSILLLYSDLYGHVPTWLWAFLMGSI